MLALQLGIPVAEMCQRMTAAEEAHWIAFYNLEPFGDQRADIRNAQLASLIHNTNVSKKSELKQIEDFMIFRPKPNQPGDDPKTIRQNFERLMARQKR